MTDHDSPIDRPGNRLPGKGEKPIDDRKRSSGIRPPPSGGKSMLTHGKKSEDLPPPPVLSHAKPPPEPKIPVFEENENEKTMQIHLDLESDAPDLLQSKRPHIRVGKKKTPPEEKKSLLKKPSLSPIKKALSAEKDDDEKAEQIEVKMEGEKPGLLRRKKTVITVEEDSSSDEDSGEVVLEGIREKDPESKPKRKSSTPPLRPAQPAAPLPPRKAVPPPAATPIPSAVARKPHISRTPSASRQLRETMRKINERKTPFEKLTQQESPDKMVDARERAKSASTLPEAMARVHEENRFQAQLNRALNEIPEESEAEEEEETAYAVDDPTPGKGKSIFHFIFSFGRFANGVQLAQPVWVTITFWLLCGLGAILPMMTILLPSNPGPRSLMQFANLGQFLGIGFCVGLIAVMVVSLLFNLTVWARFGRVGLLFGLRTVTGALLPLAVVQVLALCLNLMLLGEAFLRGATLPWFLFLQTWILPLLWIWGGLRLGQAVSRMARPPFYIAATLLVLLPVGFAATYVPLHPETTQWRIERLSETKKEIEMVRDLNPMQKLATCQQFAADLPFWSMMERREMHYTQLDLYLHLQDSRSARAEMLLLDRASVPDSAVDLVAKSINLYLARDQVGEDKKERVLTLSENLLRNAIELDAEEVNAYDWLSILKEENSLQEAADLAGKAYTINPTQKRFQRYVDLLYRLRNYEAMWDAMLEETSMPPTWPVGTLEQLAQASDQLGKVKRAEQLRNWAYPKTSETVADSDGE